MRFRLTRCCRVPSGSGKVFRTNVKNQEEILNRQQIEAWALEIAERVKADTRVEDSLVELKANWPDPEKAARRIAGHANAARGESILWIIGLDESKGVCDFDDSEIADWWAKVQTCFDGLVPGLTDIVTKTPDGPIQLLYFDTSASPFVVKNLSYGTKASGPVEREVPWREGTSIRSVTREDLIRILVPLTLLPDIEFLEGHVEVESKEPFNTSYGDTAAPSQAEPHLEWRVHITMYVTPKKNDRIVLPVHRTKLTLRIISDKDKVSELMASNIRYQSPSLWLGARGSRSDSVSIESTNSEAVIHLPGKLYVNANYYEPIRKLPPKGNLEICYSVKPAGTEHSVLKTLSFSLTEAKGDHFRRWVLTGSSDPDDE